MATATMLGIDTARPAGNGIRLEVVVCFSGAEIPTPNVQMIEIDVDPALAPTQLQAALADAIRTFGTNPQGLNLSIPSNNVNVLNFSKG